MVNRRSRRQVLIAAGRVSAELAALAAAGYVGYRWPRPQGPNSAPAFGSAGVDHFVSRPELSPPTITLTRRASAFTLGSGAPGYIFVALKGYAPDGPGQPGPMILDTQGRLVWFSHSTQSPMNLQVQQYKGQPVLTWWEGNILSGYGEGNGVILDNTYQQVATVKAGNGLQVDLHEFQLTPQNTALITAYQTATTDLSSLGGSSRGQVLDCVAQEVDVESGNVLFEWHSLANVGIAESYAQPASGTPFDYFHINSIAVESDGDLLISARNTWAIYKVSRQNGSIVWRLNGKKSNFRMGPGANFFWQHDARPQGTNGLTIFDDAASPPQESQSRGIMLSLDTTAMTANLVRQYTHPARLLAANQGNMQILPNGRVFIGWGAEPYFTEFNQDGQVLLDGRFPTDDQSYRAYSFNWTGQPADLPALVVGPNTAGRWTAYVSWNGATQVARWQILGGERPTAFDPVATAPHSGFETAIAVNAAGPYFAAAALNGSGKVLGRSPAVKA